MNLTNEQAVALLSNVAIASLNYDDDLALVDEARTAHADVSWALEALDGIELTPDEMEALRVMCGRVIVDPTTYRADFLDFVFGSASESIDEGESA